MFSSKKLWWITWSGTGVAIVIIFILFLANVEVSIFIKIGALIVLTVSTIKTILTKPVKSN